MKKILTLVACIVSLSTLVLLSACSQGTGTQPSQEAPATKTDVKVMALKGPSGVGMVDMMENGSSDSSVSYDFNLVGSTDEVVAALSSGSTDIAAIPTNLASSLYHKTNGDVRMVAINTFGNLSIVQSGTDVHSMADLRGKTIHASGQGANPQYILEYLLTQAGLTVGTDVQIVWHAEQSEVAALVASGEADVAMLPEPFVSTVLAKNPDLSIALALNDVWQQTTGDQLVMGCVVARSDFIDQNPDAVNAYLADLDRSTQWVTSNVPAAAELCVKYGLIPDQSVAEAAIPRCGLTFIDGADMQPAVESYYKVLLAANPASIGGSLPDSAFYYQASA